MADGIDIQHERVRKLNREPYDGGPVLYWMSRDQRVQDNWALLYAQHLAIEHNQPVGVAFCLLPAFLRATARHYAFMLDGLKEVETELARLRIPFFLLHGEPSREIPRFIAERSVGALITDFDPLREKQSWLASIGKKIRIPFRQVDAHNIVPCWAASPKLEYSAATLRRKLAPLVPEFLTQFPRVCSQDAVWTGMKPDWTQVLAGLRLDVSGASISWLRPGARAADRVLRTFIEDRLGSYAACSSDPNAEAQSDLSPYLHFGQLSAQRAALEVQGAAAAGKDAFMEQLIVRRELADNFCLHRPAYDTFDGLWDWAKVTLDAHRADKRAYVYDRDTFEAGETHDPLWNAAQQEMVKRGKMHNYLRMYWAKKILEWTRDPEEAFRTAVYLNDKYELDGRDPNGYTGIAWSLGGVHDRAWQERPVFGKIRYMNDKGCARKFDVPAYIARVASC